MMEMGFRVALLGEVVLLALDTLRVNKLRSEPTDRVAVDTRDLGDLIESVRNRARLPIRKRNVGAQNRECRRVEIRKNGPSGVSRLNADSPRPRRTVV